MTNETVIREIESLDYYLQRHENDYGEKSHMAMMMAIRALKQKPETGHWIRITNGAIREKYICSQCGRQIEDCGVEGLLPVKYPYCHCGARMEVKE